MGVQVVVAVVHADQLEALEVVVNNGERGYY